MDADRFSMPHEICTSQISPLKQMAPSPPRCFLVESALTAGRKNHRGGVEEACPHKSRVPG